MAVYFELFSTDCVRAGFLMKQKGVWYLTKQGEDATKLGPAGLLEAAQKAYKQWEAEQPKQPSNKADTFEEIEQTAQIREEKFSKKNLLEKKRMMRDYLFSSLY